MGHLLTKIGNVFRRSAPRPPLSISSDPERNGSMAGMNGSQYMMSPSCPVEPFPHTAPVPVTRHPTRAGVGSDPSPPPTPTVRDDENVRRLQLYVANPGPSSDGSSQTTDRNPTTPYAGPASTRPQDYPAAHPAPASPYPDQRQDPTGPPTAPPPSQASANHLPAGPPDRAREYFREAIKIILAYTTQGAQEMVFDVGQAAKYTQRGLSALGLEVDIEYGERAETTSKQSSKAYRIMCARYRTGIDQFEQALREPAGQIVSHLEDFAFESFRRALDWGRSPAILVLRLPPGPDEAPAATLAAAHDTSTGAFSQPAPVAFQDQVHQSTQLEGSAAAGPGPSTMQNRRALPQHPSPANTAPPAYRG